MKINELNKSQIVIINVGMNTKYGLPGPLFNDGTFRFVPIPETKKVRNGLGETYRQLGLEDWVSNPDNYAHNDPEFETNTYGDYRMSKRGVRLRSANLFELNKGDFLFFFSSLSKLRDRKRLKVTGFYLIGFLEIEKIFAPKEAKSSLEVRNNAHRRRENDSGYTIWKGTKRSTLFKTAVPMNRRSVDKYLRTSAGDLLPWDKPDKNGNQRTEIEIINSATRTSRLIKKREYRKEFWKLIKKKNPTLRVFS